MERKDYEKMFYNIKNDILKEIRSLIPEGGTHRFNENFYVHYIEGEVATTEPCLAIRVSHGGMVSIIIYRDNTLGNEVVDGEAVFNYDSCTFIDILDNLKKEIREKKLSHLRELVKKNGGKINFDGSFGFHSIVDGKYVAGEKSFITCIELDKTFENRVYLDCNFSGEAIEEQEEQIPLDELDNLIAYVREKTYRKFVIRVSGSFSRTFDIEASTYEEALEFAKTEWKEDAPLCPADSNGEDWEDYTSAAL